MTTLERSYRNWYHILKSFKKCGILSWISDTIVATSNWHVHTCTVQWRQWAAAGRRQITVEYFLSICKRKIMTGLELRIIVSEFVRYLVLNNFSHKVLPLRLFFMCASVIYFSYRSVVQFMVLAAIITFETENVVKIIKRSAIGKCSFIFFPNYKLHCYLSFSTVVKYANFGSFFNWKIWFFNCRHLWCSSGHLYTIPQTNNSSSHCSIGDNSNTYASIYF